MRWIPFVLLTLALGSRWAEASSCDIRDPADIPRKQIPRVEVREALRSDPKEAIRTWLRTMPRFKGISEKDLVVIRNPSQVSGNNWAVYEVFTSSGRYFVKVVEEDRISPNFRPEESLRGPIVCEEFERLLRLQETIYFHPECLASEAQEKAGLRVASAEDLEALPKLIPLLDAVHFHNLCWGLFKAAPGKDLEGLLTDTTPSSEVRTRALFSKWGRAVGLLHFFYSNYRKGEVANLSTWTTFTHGDLRPGNVFYDEETDQFSLIDNSEVGSGPLGSQYDYRTMSFDLLQSGLWPVAGLAVQLKDRVKWRLEQRAESLFWIAKVDREIPWRVFSRGPLYAGRTAMVYDQSMKIVQSEFSLLVPYSEEKMKNATGLVSVFINGYLSAFPNPLLEQLKFAFMDFCGSFIDLPLYEGKSWPERERKSIQVQYVEILKEYFPWVWTCQKGDIF